MPIIDLCFEVQKALFPQSAIRRLKQRRERPDAVDPVDDTAQLLVLYQRTAQLTEAAMCYQLIVDTVKALLVHLPGLNEARSHTFALAFAAAYEDKVLGDHELAVATAKRAFDMAERYHLGSVTELLRHDFPEIFIVK